MNPVSKGIRMEDKRFDRPVKILAGRFITVSRQVDTAVEAVEYLLDKWPEKTGGKYHAALAACLAVLEDEGDARVARLAFEDAADEARILVKQP